MVLSLGWVVLTFFLDLLRHQKLIALDGGGVVAADDSHRILKLVGNFSWEKESKRWAS